MRTLKHYLIAGVFLAVVFVLGYFAAIFALSIASGAPATRDDNYQPSRLGQSCIPTVSAVVIGNQNSLDLVAEDRHRAWLLIQQPNNATNTVSLNIASSTAVLGEGYTLGTTTDGLHSTFPLEFELGVQINRPATTTITGITDLGSTTVNVINCIYD